MTLNPKAFLLPIAASVMFGWVPAGRADEPLAEARAAVEQAKEENPELTVEWDKATGLPRRIRGIAPKLAPGARAAAPPAAAAAPSEADVKAVVQSWFAARQLSRAMNANANADVEVPNVRQDPDIAQQYIATVEQRLNGIPVFASSAKVVVGSTARGLGVTNVSSAKFSPLDIDQTTPQIAADAAIAAARAALEAESAKALDETVKAEITREMSASAPTAELAYFDPKLIGRTGGDAASVKTRLTWRVELGGWKYFVDAMDGTIVHFFHDRPSAMVRLVSDMTGAAALPGNILVDEAAGVSQDLRSEPKAAFDNLARVYDFYSRAFGRDSFDDNDLTGPKGGAKLEAYVLYAGAGSNAYWCTANSGCLKPNAMFFGQGWARPLDITAHEFTHGVMIHEDGPEYTDEPGAVNEAFADIFGALIEQSSSGGNWVIGEDLPGRSAAFPLRSLSEPHMRGFARDNIINPATNNGQPDHYTEVVRRTDLMCRALVGQDNGCVHINSGIVNKLAHLIAQGGAHHDHAVSGLGVEKLGRLSYRVLTTKLLAGTTIPDAAAAFREACDELKEADVDPWSASDCGSVNDATEAVGLPSPTT